MDRPRRATLPWSTALLLAVVVFGTGLLGCASETGSRSSASNGPGGSDVPVPSRTAGSAAPAATGGPSATASEVPGGATIDRPWATATLTNVTTGEPFRVADLVASGKVVFVETMAIWCSNCRRQQIEATTAFETLDPTRVEWVALDIETTETADALARYREQNGFPFTYAIADQDLARALVADFGEVVLSPPNVNTIVIGTDGRITQLRGHHGADEIRQLAADHGA